MSEEKLGCGWKLWNITWFVTLVLSLLFAFWTFVLSDGPNHLRLASAFGIATGGIGTVAQLLKKRDGFLNAVKHEFFITRKSISGTALWIRNQLFEKIEQSEENIKKHITSEADRRRNAESEEKREGTYRQADLRTLQKLWPYITPRIISHIVELVGTTALEGIFVSHSLHRYQDLRRDHSELHFVNEDLESAFTRFDDDLLKFTRFLGNRATVEFFNGRMVYLSEYHQATKLHPELNALMGVDQARIQELLNVHHEIESRAVEMQSAHRLLIKSIQHLLPEFDFPDDDRALQEMEESRRQHNEFVHRRRAGKIEPN